MTSKHCFSNFMREDFRHKIWMLALSILGNVLALPIVFLLFVANKYNAGSPLYAITTEAHGVSHFLTTNILIGSGIIALIGAVIVALGGFRYLYHRNMVDTFESLPIKKRVRFCAVWLNGFLIWFVPFVINYILTVALVINKYQGMHREYLALANVVNESIVWYTTGEMVKIAAVSMVTLVVSFLVVYNMMILAMMLCGNVINTLAVNTTLGCGVALVYGLLMVLGDYYLDTWLDNLDFLFDKVVFLSPVVSAIYNLLRNMAENISLESLGNGMVLFGNLVLAVILMALAYLAYEKRPSEMAEQGTKNKVVCICTQGLISLVAVLGGWLVLYTVANGVSEGQGVIWGLFGGLLSGWFIFGVMNIIFEMDFKAFFKKKLYMLGILVAGILICCTFVFDWMGFDAYVPEREKIAALSVYSPDFSSCGYWRLESDFGNPEMITDKDLISTFLQGAIDDPREEEDYNYITVYCKVTLTSGRSYQRRYFISGEHYDETMAIFMTPGYMEENYKIPEEIADKTEYLDFNRDSIFEQISNGMTRPLAASLIRAFNRDLLENPEAVLVSNITYCEVFIATETGMPNYTIVVRKGMTNTIEAMETYGYGEFASPLDVSKVKEVHVGLTCWTADDVEVDWNEVLRTYFGEEVTVEGLMQGLTEEEYVEKVENGDFGVPIAVRDEYRYLVGVVITDEAEMKSVLENCSYAYIYNGNWYLQGSQAAEGNNLAITMDGNEIYLYANSETIPKKYAHSMLAYMIKIRQAYLLDME